MEKINKEVHTVRSKHETKTITTYKTIDGRTFYKEEGAQKHEEFFAFLDNNLHQLVLPEFKNIEMPGTLSMYWHDGNAENLERLVKYHGHEGKFDKQYPPGWYLVKFIYGYDYPNVVEIIDAKQWMEQLESCIKQMKHHIESVKGKDKQ